MENTIGNEFIELIKAKLPSIEVDIFRNFIDEAKNDKEQLARMGVHNKSLQQQIETLNTSIREQQNKIDNYQEIVKSLQQKIKTDENLSERERNLEITILKEQLNSTREAKSDIFRLVNTLFNTPTKVTELRDTVLQSFTSNSYDYQGKELHHTSQSLMPVTKTTIEKTLDSDTIV